MADSRWRDIDPLYWMREALRISGKALTRLWGRDVMLYTGGVSFFVLLAAFPGIAIAIGIYSLLADAGQVTAQLEGLTRLMPPGAQGLFIEELERLAHAPLEVVSAQSLVALVIGGYAAHRGFKALLSGLSFIHEEDKPHGFIRFNLLALVVLVAAIAMVGGVAVIFLFFRLLAATLHLQPMAGIFWLYSEWTWTSVGMFAAMTLIYRFAMSTEPVVWRASMVGGAAATALSLFMSWASAFYVEQIASLGATYGSIATVVVFLIWLSWNVNAIFFGGALATEVEIAIGHAPPKLLPDLRGSKAIASPPRS